MLRGGLVGVEVLVLVVEVLAVGGGAWGRVGRLVGGEVIGQKTKIARA